MGIGYTAQAADPELGRSQAATCTACHGYKGITVNTEWPNLAGQKQTYLVKQIKDFRDGNRKDPLMTGRLDNYSDEIIENIAAWFSGLSP
jgi:cytochrome c553